MCMGVFVDIIYSFEALNQWSQKTRKINYLGINRERTGGILNNKLNDEYDLNTFKLIKGQQYKCKSDV